VSKRALSKFKTRTLKVQAPMTRKSIPTLFTTFRWRWLTYRHQRAKMEIMIRCIMSLIKY